MKKPTISVAIATYNEEKNIGDCLNYVKDWADEIVVVDGSSQDKTREIAKKLGARVIKTTNKTFFDSNKNMAIKACLNEWIFLLDADERVTHELAEEIRKTVNHWVPGQPVAYWMPRKNYFLGRYLQKGGQYPDPIIRLFKKGKALLPQDSVHKQLEIDGQTGWLKTDLIHWATPEFSRYWLRERRYSTLEAKFMLEKKLPINPFIFLKYVIYLPVKTFLMIFIRHKGFVDSWQGFVFAFFSGWHWAWSYLKYLRMRFKKVDIQKEWR